MEMTDIFPLRTICCHHHVGQFCYSHQTIHLHVHLAYFWGHQGLCMPAFYLWRLFHSRKCHGVWYLFWKALGRHPEVSQVQGLLAARTVLQLPTVCQLRCPSSLLGSFVQEQHDPELCANTQTLTSSRKSTF